MPSWNYLQCWVWSWRSQISSHLLRLHVRITIRFDLRPWSEWRLPSGQLLSRPCWLGHRHRMELLWTNTPWHRWNWQNWWQSRLVCWCSRQCSITCISRRCRWWSTPPWFRPLRSCYCCSTCASCNCCTWNFHFCRRWSLRIRLPIEQNGWNLRWWTLLRQWKMRRSQCCSWFLRRFSRWWSLRSWWRSTCCSRRC